MFSLKNALGRFAQRQSLAALGARFAGDDGIAVSVLCVSRDADSYLDLFLASLENQLLPLSRFEVLVFDNGSLDDTRETLARFEGRKRLNLHTETSSEVVGQARAWNRLAEQARGGVLVLASEALIAHPPLLVGHLMAHLEGVALLCGAPIAGVHSHLFPIQLFPPLDVRPSPIVSSEEEGWIEFLAPFVCSVEPMPERPADWTDFDFSHASLRRETMRILSPFRGEGREDFGDWGLTSREFALRAHNVGIGIRFLAAPSAWQSLKPSVLVAIEQAGREMSRFFAQHPELERASIEAQLNERLLPSAIPAWSL